MIEDSTPVLVGAGQHVQRDTEAVLAGGAPPSPMDLVGEAARRALADAAAGVDLAGAVDTLAVMRLFSDSVPRRAHEFGRATNPPRSVARRVGADPEHALYARVGGNTPQLYLNLMAERIARGEAEVVLLAGGEALATLKGAVRTGMHLDWSEEVPGTLEDHDIGRPYLAPREREHGIGYPIYTYPLFEQAIRGGRGATLEEHLHSMGRLFAPFTRVAARNPYASFPIERSAEELATVNDENPFIGLPYPRYMNARDGVDQAAAVVLTSAKRARSLGIPSERWVFLHGCADASEPQVLERSAYDRCPALEVAAERAFAMASMGIDDVSLIDLYSCFPSAVEVACRELGLAEDDARGLTVTGGLPFFGGPGNNYSMHAVAEMVGRLREDPEGVGLVWANGGYLSTHSMGLYSSRPVEGRWSREDTEHDQRRVDAVPRPAVTDRAEGAARIETYSVPFGKEGPVRGIVIGRLEETGERFIANLPEGNRQMVERLVSEEPLGAPGRVHTDGGRHLFEW